MQQGNENLISATMYKNLHTASVPPKHTVLGIAFNLQ